MLCTVCLIQSTDQNSNDLIIWGWSHVPLSHKWILSGDSHSTYQPEAFAAMRLGHWCTVFLYNWSFLSTELARTLAHVTCNPSIARMFPWRRSWEQPVTHVLGTYLLTWIFCDWICLNVRSPTVLQSASLSPTLSDFFQIYLHWLSSFSLYQLLLQNSDWRQNINKVRSITIKHCDGIKHNKNLSEDRDAGRNCSCIWL